MSITKEKIAISLDKPLLTLVDALVDGTTVRSRSQAIESLVRKGLAQEYIRDAVILIKKEHQQLLLQKIDGKPLLVRHLELLEKANIKQCYLITPETSVTQMFSSLLGKRKIHFTHIPEPVASGTVGALRLLQDKVSTNFVVLLGDTYNHFDLTKMILFHLNKNKIATVGLMSHNTPSLYSSVELEGDRIVAFRNKKKSASFIVDAGVYVFNVMLFQYFNSSARFFEKDVLPKLCALDQMNGYFTFGHYKHFGE